MFIHVCIICVCTYIISSFYYNLYYSLKCNIIINTIYIQSFINPVTIYYLLGAGIRSRTTTEQQQKICFHNAYLLERRNR